MQRDGLAACVKYASDRIQAAEFNFSQSGEANGLQNVGATRTLVLLSDAVDLLLAALFHVLRTQFAECTMRLTSGAHTFLTFAFVRRLDSPALALGLVWPCDLPGTDGLTAGPFVRSLTSCVRCCAQIQVDRFNNGDLSNDGFNLPPKQVQYQHTADLYDLVRALVLLSAMPAPRRTHAAWCACRITIGTLAIWRASCSALTTSPTSAFRPSG